MFLKIVTLAEGVSAGLFLAVKLFQFNSRSTKYIMFIIKFCIPPSKPKGKEAQKLIDVPERPHGKPNEQLFPKQAVIRSASLNKSSSNIYFTCYRYLTIGFLLLRNFSVAISVSPYVCFIIVLIFDFYVSKIKLLLARNLPSKPNIQVSEEPRQKNGRGLVNRKLADAPAQKRPQ